MFDAPNADVYAPRHWPPGTQPMVPGSPSSPPHPTQLRVAYFGVGILVGLTGGLGNSLAIVNLASLQGALGADVSEMQWLPTAYAMTMVSMNLLLVKFRQQYGLHLFTELALASYAGVTVLHLFVDSLAAAIAVRAAHGIAGAAMTVLGLYYVLQACPPAWRLRGLVIGIGLPQLSMPLARLLSPRLVDFGQWQGLYLFETGLALISLAAVLVLKLPLGDRSRAFSPPDFLTFALFAPGAALLCAVLGLGKAEWWFEAPWIGICLALAITLLCAALLYERQRSQPLLNIRWLTKGQIAILFASALLIRIVLAEAGGAIGFQQSLGLNNEQMSELWVVVLAGSVAGLIVSAVLLTPTRVIPLLMASLSCIAAGSFMDASATSMVRPEQMMVTQFLLAFGGTLFFGPAFVGGFGAVLTDPRNLVSFAVMFTITQTIGALAGNALVMTIFTLRQKFHSSQIVEHLSMIDPLVAERIRTGAQALTGIVTDPATRSVYSAANLGAVASREAAVLAYNDVFLAIAILASATFLWLSAMQIRARLAQCAAGGING